MMKYTYLLILFLTVAICFIASFDRRILFYHSFGAFIKASLIVALPFVAWDVCFTEMGVWWFDSNYTIGISLLGLPIEEWLFFICIPFSCVFTYFCIEKFFKLNGLASFNKIIVFVSMVSCAVFGYLNLEKIYTLVTAIALFSTIIYLHYISRVDWIASASLVFTILMLGFFPVNGVLTGFGLDSPIVNYNPNDFMGVRMLTIPVEDAVYGYTQFLWVLYFFKRFNYKAKLG